MAVASALGADVFPPDLAARSFAAVRSWGTVGFILMMAVIYLRPGMTGGTRFFYLTALFHLASIMGTLVVRRERPQAHRKEHPLHGARQLLASPNVLAFVVAFFLSQFALMSSTANMSLYLSAFHPRPSPGIVPLSYGIAATVELPFLMAMGWAADRFGRTLTLAVAFIVLPLRLVAYYLAPTATVAVALQALHGLTFSVLAIVPFAFIADVTPPRYNATGQAVLHAATTAALAVGPAAAGAVAAVVGIRTLYLWLAVAAAAGSVIFFALVREPVRQPAPGPQRT